MRTHTEAISHSMQNPTELVEFKQIYSNMTSYLTGFFLNGEREGVFNCYSYNNNIEQRDTYNSKTSQVEHLRFRPDGSISRHFFSQSYVTHGEYKWFGEDGSVYDHHFNINNEHIKELDYLINTERDDAFYVTLALCGIDKEYTFK